MTFLARVWLAITIVLAIVTAIFTILAKLQHEAVYSQLLRQRLSVIATATATPFRSVSQMGMDVQTVRNAQDLLNRAWQSDPKISNILLFDASGKVIFSVKGGDVPFSVHEMSRAIEDERDGKWGLETPTALVGGATILNENDEPAGGLAVIYPLNELRAHSSLVGAKILKAALALLAAFSIIAYIMLRYRLRPAIRSLDDIASHAEDNADLGGVTSIRDFPHFRATLAESTAKYRAARGALANVVGWDNEDLVLTGTQEAKVISVSDGATATEVTRRLPLLIAILVMGLTASLGYVAFRSINESFAPELNKRTELIGSIANDAIALTLKSGVPLNAMVGGRDYFDSLLKNFPEISSFALISTHPNLELGDQSGSATVAKVKPDIIVPVAFDGNIVAQVTMMKNSGYLSHQFQDVILDLLVVTLVTVLLAIELVSLMTNHALTAPLTRIEYLLNLQSIGDFSRRISATGVSAVDRLSKTLSMRAESLAAMISVARRIPSGKFTNALDEFNFAIGRPTLMRFCSLSDVRLPLFLFAAADAFPLSFFSLYVRDANNPLTWLTPGIAISLPLAAYLLAIVVVSPYARQLSHRFGHRNLFLLGTVPGVLSNLGFFFATNVPEIAFFCVLSGCGYAFASLSCQDYVIDAAPTEQRAQALGLFHVAIFGGVYAGTALGGVVADRLGESSVFLICAALIVISGAMIFRMLPGLSHVPTSTKPERHSSGRLLLATIANGRFATLLFGVVLPQTILDQVFISYLLSLQMNALGFSTADTGRMMMIYFLMVIVSGSLYGRLSNRKISSPAIILAGSLLAGTTLLAASINTNGWTLLFAAIGTGLGYGMVRGPQTAMVMDLAEGNLAHIGSESVLGTVRLIERLGSVAGLLLVAGIAGSIGYSGGMAVIAILVLAGICAYFFYEIAIIGLPLTKKGSEI